MFGWQVLLDMLVRSQSIDCRGMAPWFPISLTQVCIRRYFLQVCVTPELQALAVNARIHQHVDESTLDLTVLNEGYILCKIYISNESIVPKKQTVPSLQSISTHVPTLMRDELSCNCWLQTPLVNKYASSEFKLAPVFCQWPMNSFGIHVVCEKNLLSEHLFFQQSQYFEHQVWEVVALLCCVGETQKFESRLQFG